MVDPCDLVYVDSKYAFSIIKRNNEPLLYVNGPLGIHLLNFSNDNVPLKRLQIAIVELNINLTGQKVARILHLEKADLVNRHHYIVKKPQLGKDIFRVVGKHA